MSKYFVKILSVCALVVLLPLIVLSTSCEKAAYKVNIESFNGSGVFNTYVFSPKDGLLGIVDVPNLRRGYEFKGIKIGKNTYTVSDLYSNEFKTVVIENANEDNLVSATFVWECNYKDILISEVAFKRTNKDVKIINADGEIVDIKTLDFVISFVDEENGFKLEDEILSIFERYKFVNSNGEEVEIKTLIVHVQNQPFASFNPYSTSVKWLDLAVYANTDDNKDIWDGKGLRIILGF